MKVLATLLLVFGLLLMVTGLLLFVQMMTAQPLPGETISSVRDSCPYCDRDDSLLVGHTTPLVLFHQDDFILGTHERGAPLFCEYCHYVKDQTGTLLPEAKRVLVELLTEVNP